MKKLRKRQGTVQRWIERMLGEEPPRSKSLIMTIFGDSLLPYPSGLFLGELIAILHPFGVNAQLTRTSGFRLAEEGWLQSERLGRRSRYALTGSGRQRVENAHQRIYEPPESRWNGRWTVVIFSRSNPVAERGELRRELEWQGFGLLRSGIFVHPGPDMLSLGELLHRLRVAEQVLLLEAQDLAALASGSMEALAAECWDLPLVAAHYESFLKRFEPLLPLLTGVTEAETAFVLQTLLIHSYRRVVLHDPQLPGALLPSAWPGHAAYDLCREIHRHTCVPASRHVAGHLEEGDARTTAAVRTFAAREGA